WQIFPAKRCRNDSADLPAMQRDDRGMVIDSGREGIGDRGCGRLEHGVIQPFPDAISVHPSRVIT
ncbi:MAG: hypothetical protein RBT51_09480, partial [Ectothiorhodospiraceae bacterium]|nr:hypothetical protein [Ectothiorhodospiraceae bacterium]